MPKEHVETTLTVAEKARGAFLGAAIGDALGWPNEMPNRRVKEDRYENRSNAQTFQTWRRRSGGRFMPHEDEILAGEYSDDTQLVLCTARSLLQGREWLKHFACIELPTWSLYRRGGGGSTNRAVDIWVDGQSPWSQEIEDEKRRRYFDAGGNGVAMRILPHAICGASDNTFHSTAKAILANGICTHGHPRALIGALAYGYAIWQALRLSGTLPYGHLLELVISSSREWSLFPESAGILSKWRDAAQEITKHKFGELWSETIEEMRTLFERSLTGIRAGALSMDSRVLSDLGCFDKSRNGAGTVCAAASLYIASKYAPDPRNGVLEAAVAKGADTDTLASMAGALLGAIAGSEWFQSYREQLQDESYIGHLADSLGSMSCAQDSDLEPVIPGSKPRVAIDQFFEGLLISKKADSLRLPDGRQAFIEAITAVPTTSKNLRGRVWKMRTGDGQSIYVKKFERGSGAPSEQLSLAGEIPRPPTKKSPRFTSKVKAVKLLVKDMDRAREFYSQVLALKVVRESKTLINFGGLISLVPANYATEMGLSSEQNLRTRCIVCVETSDIEVSHQRASRFPEASATGITEKAGRRVFRCTDFDGNILEVFEALPRASTSVPS